MASHLRALPWLLIAVGIFDPLCGAVALAANTAPINTVKNALGFAPTDAQAVSYIASGLVSPIGLVNAGDGSNRLFVVQQGNTSNGTPGRARVIRNDALLTNPLFAINTTFNCRPTPSSGALNIGFSAGNERGFLGLAFHPGFETNGEVFASLTDGRGDTAIVRFTMANPALDEMTTTDLDTCTVIFRVDQDFSNHNGGHIAFGPDGYLYLGLGDGGLGNDPCDRGQTLNPANLPANDANDGGCPVDTNFTGFGGGNFAGGNANSRALLGKMIRLDINATTPPGANTLCAANGDGSANYAIPTSNPFAGADPTSACDEVWAYGVRNPWKFSFDRSTGDLIIGDVGQDRWEEISFQPASSVGGENYGWKLCEGTHARGTCNSSCTSTGLSTSVLPFIEINNSGNTCGANGLLTGCSITGGYRYRGPDVALQGVYFYGDNCTGVLWYAIESAPGVWTAPTSAVNIQTLGGIPAFGEDEQGRVYVIGGGTIYRIQAVIQDPLFANGFES